MNTVCWKELREHFRWALLAAAVLGFAAWFTLRTDPGYGGGSYYYGRDFGLCAEGFLSVTTFGSAICGLLLGLLQILPETRRDRWASLLHRPVSRGVVFRGKVMGGLILYALATVPPFLFSMWFMSTPGRLSCPFVPAMMLPGVADICAGSVYYFAALAFALPRGGWIGARLLPFFAAVHVSKFVLATDVFSEAVAAAAWMALAVFTAGWGIMLNQEEFGARPRLAKAALLAVMFYGVCGLGGLGRSLYAVAGPSFQSRSSHYELSDLGVPLRLTYENDVVTEVTSLDEQPIADKKYQPVQVRNHLKSLNGCCSYIGDSHGWRAPDYHRGYRDPYHYLSFANSYQYPRWEQWFRLVEQRTWIGYAVNAKQAFGRLDRNGFVPLPSSPAPFEAGMKFDEFGDKLLLFDAASVRVASLSGRTIKDVKLRAAGPIYGLGTAFARSAAGGSVSVFSVALAGGLAIYDETGALVTTLGYHRDVSRWGKLSLEMNGARDRFYVKYEPSVWIDGETQRSMPSYLEEMDGTGRVLNSYTLPRLPPDYHSRRASDIVADRIQSPAFFFGSMGYQKIGAVFGSERLAGELARRFGHDWGRTMELAWWIVGVALALALATLFWARRACFTWRRSVGWAVFVLAGGVAAFAAFRLTVDWPQFVPCSRCGKPRPVADDRCPRCEAGWPAPPVEGTEIFDSVPEHTLVAVRA